MNGTSTGPSIPADGVRDLLTALIDALWLPRPVSFDDNEAFLDAQRDRAVSVATLARTLARDCKEQTAVQVTASLRVVAAETLPYAVREEES